MTKLYKYPRTFHLPWSPGRTSDDRVLSSIDGFVGQQVVVTEKMDGECTTMYHDHVHARSLDSGHHPSRSWLKGLHSQVAYKIPEGWRICGENLFAKHSILYDKLPSYFLVFSIWNERNVCLPWEATRDKAPELGLSCVPELYKWLWDEEAVKQCWTGKSQFGPEQEGYVVRFIEGFAYEEFPHRIAKYVRQGHVQTDENWMNQPVVRNKATFDSIG